MKNSIGLLKQCKLKVTSSRLSVLECLTAANAPIDSSSIFEYLNKSDIHIDRATVFRVLKTFKNNGIIKLIQLNESKFRYELASKPEHHHIICTVCGNIQDINICIDKKMEDEISRSTGFTINKHMLEFTGVCSKCNEKI